MVDDKIKDLFRNFEPEISSSAMFMSRVQKNMEAVEIIKQHNAAMKRRNALAMAIAAMSGLITGVILTLLLPMIGNLIKTFSITIHNVSQISIVPIDYDVVAWIVVAALCLISALNAYEIASAAICRANCSTSRCPTN